jgi:hypothetical protein
MSEAPSPPLFDVIAVEPLQEFNLRLTFENGEIRLYSMANFLACASGVFVPLRQIDLFRQAFVADGTVCWPGGLDVDPELLYERSVPECLDDLANNSAEMEENPNLRNEKADDKLEGEVALLASVQFKTGLPIGTVVELLDSDTVLVEFADDQGKTQLLVPVPKVLLEHARSAGALNDNDGKRIDVAKVKTEHRDDVADPVIGHMTPAGGNVFLDLGFLPEEAAQLKQDSDKRIAAQKIGGPAKNHPSRNLRGQMKS